MLVKLLARRDYLWAALIVVYFGIIAHFAQNIPSQDDYDAVLYALANYLDNKDTLAFLFWPHNEHVIFFVRSFTWLIYKSTGQVNFFALIIVGNIFLVGLFIACAVILRKLVALSLPLLLILVLILFNFSFWESNLWAMASLSNIAVLAVTAWALACLGGEANWRNVVLGLVLAMVASVSQANGVFAPLVCLLYLAAQRRWKTALVFVPVVLLCASFFRKAHAAQALNSVLVGDPLFALSHPLAAIRYFLMFLGSVLRYPNAAVLLGIVMLLIWAFALFKNRALWRSPANAVIVFVLITAAAATVGRISLGVDGATASRYSLNSVLFLAMLLGMVWPWIQNKVWLERGLVLVALLANAATFYLAVPQIKARANAKNELFAPAGNCEPRRTDYPDQAHAEMVVNKAMQYGLYPFPPSTMNASCLDADQGKAPVPVRLTAASGRALTLTKEGVVIAGFVITGGKKTVLITAKGPSLVAAGITGILADPKLRLVDSKGESVAANDNWGEDTKAGNITLLGAKLEEHESAILTTLAPGIYTAIMDGTHGTTGNGLIEVTGIPNSNDKGTISSMSIRGLAGAADSPLIAGFVVSGKARTVLITVAGPSLAKAGIAEALTDPVLELHDSSGALVERNDSWGASKSAKELAASGKHPADPKESAIQAVLPPGAYTAIVRSASGVRGVSVVTIDTAE